MTNQSTPNWAIDSDVVDSRDFAICEINGRFLVCPAGIDRRDWAIFDNLPDAEFYYETI